MVTPSPLRKERKSGFLSPSLAFNFVDTKTSQSVAFPYYFNISIDKELTFTPIIKYGGGVDSSQRFLFDYDQLISGGNLSTDLSLDTKLENQNNESWFNIIDAFPALNSSNILIIARVVVDSLPCIWDHISTFTGPCPNFNP